ncbi:MAG: aminoacyl-tRNA hydrolase [bacterium]
MSDERYLVVGLGNPGPRYAGTRHNAGFLVLDVLADRAGGRFKSSKHRAEVLEGRLVAHPAVLAKPLTYMNDSGAAVVNLGRFYKVPPQRTVVIYDELDLPYGTVRLKIGGGDSGHNGLKSITAALSTREYARVRFGIGRPPGRQEPADYVLRDFDTVQRRTLELELDRAADAVEMLLEHGLEPAQNAFH